MPRSAMGHPDAFASCRLGRWFWCLLLPLCFPAIAHGESAPTFRNDVMAVLSKAGCNSGPCHGNQNGKRGFRLSLRGQDPQQDYQWLVRQYAGRRIDRLDPQRSLMLLKATGRIAHQGGIRFRRDSQAYRILRDWIAAGAPAPQSTTPRLRSLLVTPPTGVVVAEPEQQVQLQVTAVFDDGQRRDVSALAVYETSNLVASVDEAGLVQRQTFGETTVIVRFLDQQIPVTLAFIPARPDFVWSEPQADNYIDRHVFAKLRRLRVNPSPRSDDYTWVRRAYIDALGILPTAEEARRFVASTHPDKRQRLIDYLLSRPEFADHWALKWSDLLRNEEKVLDSKGVEVFHGWIRGWIAGGRPMDQFVRQLVSARGSTYDHPPANYYRANRNPTARAETTARLFLGVRLQCAKCHNHPFDRWTQDDYYAWAALFSRIDYKILQNERQDKFDKNEFKGEQIVQLKDSGEVINVRTGRAAAERFLGADAVEFEPRADRLKLLAAWLTAPENQQFCRAQVNLIWYHLMGRGLVEPIDDFRLTNPPVNAALLNALAADFAAHGFRLRHLVRTIMTSRTYQLSAEPNETNTLDEANFARATVRRLKAETLLDAQCQVLDVPAQFAGYQPGIRAGQIPGVRKVRRRTSSPGEGDRFLMTFGKPERLLGCECERSNETTLNQAFVLIGGEGLNRRLAQPGNRLDRMLQADGSHAQMVQQLYWTALSRPPKPSEAEAALALLASDEDPFVALQDLAWALMNAKEFLFRH